MNKSIVFALMVIANFCTASVFANGSTEDFVGKKWSDLPKSKYPGFRLPLTWPGERKFALRYYQPTFGRYVVTITEIVDSNDQSKDLIAAALDLRSVLKGDPNSKVIEVPSNDCAEKLHADESEVVIGIITQNTDKPQKKYKPKRAWKIESKNMKFEELKASKVGCEPQNYGN